MDVELSGNTRFLSLFDLVQVLSVNEATGMLRIDDGSDKGYLYFQQGTVINAMDAAHREGEDAAMRIFAIRDADFSFSSDLPSVAHRITCTTQNLMMEIARRLDEEGHGEANLDEAQQATTLLNELFSQLDSESKILAHRSPQGIQLGDLLASIRDSPESTLFLRAGDRPEVQVAGRIIPISEARLEEPDYENLRDHLVRESLGGTDPTRVEADEYVLRITEHEHYRLSLVRFDAEEVLTVRRLPSARDLAGGLPWPTEDLRGVIQEPGSLAILVGQNTLAVERGIEAACAYLVEHGPGPLIGLARHWPPGLGADRASALLLTTRGTDHADRVRDLIDQVSPGLFVVEDSDNPHALPLALRAIRRGARAIVGVCALSAPLAPHRLLDPVPAEDRARLVPYLGTYLAGILTVEGLGGTTGRAWCVSEETRASLREGDLDALVRDISKTAPSSV